MNKKKSVRLALKLKKTPTKIVDKINMEIKPTLEIKKKPLKIKRGNKFSTIDEVKEVFFHQDGYSHCYVVDELSGTGSELTIKSELIPKDVIPINDGESMYLLNFDGKEFTAINYTPTDNAGQTPDVTMDFMNWQPLEKVLKFTHSYTEKIQIGIMVGLIVGLLIVFSLVAMMGMGH